MTLIYKLSEFRADDKFLVVALLHSSYDLRVDTEALRDLDDLLGMLRRKINLETMAHVEHLVHQSFHNQILPENTQKKTMGLIL